MTLPFAYFPEVMDEIDHAYAWYEGQQGGLGWKFLSALRDHLDRIQINPEAYAVLYRQIRPAPMRRFPYVVYYRIDTDRITVIAVQHGRQAPRNWRRRT